MEPNADRNVLEDWVHNYHAVLYRLAFRLCGSATDAEDLVQDTFLTASRKATQLRAEQAALAWLMQILRRHWLDLCRSRPAMESLSLNEIENCEPFEEPLPEHWDADRLVQALEQMPHELREPLVLFYFNDLKYREIAETLECPIGTVMSRLARAKFFLRSMLAPEESAKLPGDKL